MKKFKVSFEMKIKSDCTVQRPEEMLGKDQEDGFELGFDLSNIEVIELLVLEGETDDFESMY